MSAELSDATIAEAFLAERGRFGLGSSPESLIDDVEEYLARVGLPWRSAASVARVVDQLLSQTSAPRPDQRPAPAIDPGEELAFTNDVRQGTTATDPMGLLPDIANMSMAEFSRIRGQIGLGGSRDAGIFGRLV